MISLIIGKKGSGKTKKMVDLVNSTTEKSNGNVVCIEKEANLTFNVTNKARLLDTDYYSISGADALYGFICGICAGNYDVTDVFIDAIFKIVGKNYDMVSDLIAKLDKLSKDSDVNFYLTISADKDALPKEMFRYAEEI
jgi:hypothetical protein